MSAETQYLSNYTFPKAEMSSIILTLSSGLQKDPQEIICWLEPCVVSQDTIFLLRHFFYQHIKHIFLRILEFKIKKNLNFLKQVRIDRKKER